MKFYLLILSILIFPEITSQTFVIEEGVKRDTSFNLSATFLKERKKRPFITVPDTVLPKGVAKQQPIGYYSPYEGRTLQITLFRPDNDSIYPALLMVHGGGWSSGKPSLQEPMAMRIAKAGYVTIPVEYRLSPEALYPAGLHDLKRAVRFLRNESARLGIRPDQIAISGCSAGGMLAALVGTTNLNPFYEPDNDEVLEASQVQAVIDIDGVVDFTQNESTLSLSVLAEKGKQSAGIIWLGGTIHTNRKNWLDASAVFQVSKHSAPICFINSSIPRFHDGRDEMRALLDKEGIYSEVTTWEDTPHPFWLFNPWIEPTVEVVICFLDKIFK